MAQNVALGPQNLDIHPLVATLPTAGRQAFRPEPAHEGTTHPRGAIERRARSRQERLAAELTYDEPRCPGRLPVTEFLAGIFLPAHDVERIHVVDVPDNQWSTTNSESPSSLISNWPLLTEAPGLASRRRSGFGVGDIASARESLCRVLPLHSIDSKTEVFGHLPTTIPFVPRNMMKEEVIAPVLVTPFSVHLSVDQESVPELINLLGGNDF